MKTFRKAISSLRKRFTPTIYLISASNWKYGLILLFALFLEIRAEFNKLSKEEKQAIIEKHIIESGEDLEAKEAWYNAQKQIKTLRRNIDEGVTLMTDSSVLSDLNYISEYVKKSTGKGYQKGKAEISRIQWFEWDFYYISYAFLQLLSCIFIAIDGRRYVLKDSLEKPLINKTSFILYITAIPWYLYSFISQIILRSERLFKEELLVFMLLIFCSMILAAFWYDLTNNNPKAQIAIWSNDLIEFLKFRNSRKSTNSELINTEPESFKTRKQMADEFEISVDTLRRRLQKKNVELPKGALSPESQAIIRKTLGKS